MENDTNLVFLNGEYYPITEAKVSVLDRGYLFGDGVYEVIPAYSGTPFRVAEHLQRLSNSLSNVKIPSPYSQAEWQSIFDKLLANFPSGDSSIYLQVTRGVQAKRDHAFPADLHPSVFAMANPINHPATLSEGIEAITLDDIRWGYCHIKAITLLANVLLKQQAVDAGAGEAILIKQGHATEGSASNLFIVKDGVIITPPKDHQVLPGITRDLILELAQQHNMALNEVHITEQALREADEVWVTSSTKEIVPIIKLDQKVVGNGKPGKIWQQMMRYFAAYKDAIRQGKVR
jgi:D-alanine transaminase